MMADRTPDPRTLELLRENARLRADNERLRVECAQLRRANRNLRNVVLPA
jgi:hypothetical protein